MPIYHYRCKNCLAEDTVTAKMNDEPPEQLETCEDDCAAPQIEKVPARTGFALKGRGWFKDGY